MTIPYKTVDKVFCIEDSPISQEQLSAALKEAKKSQQPLTRTLVKLGFVSEIELLTFLSQTLKIPFVHLSMEKVDLQLISQVPAKMATHYHIMPLKSKDNRLTITISDPLNSELFDELKFVLNKEFDLAISTEEDISRAIKQYYGIGAETVEEMLAENDKEIEVLSATKKDEDIEDEAIDASVVKFVNQIISEALKERATDIHLEPFENEFRVRYRIDSLLYEVAVPPSIRHFQSSIVSRIKIMADLNIAEKRIPQDGRIKIRMGKNEFDLRISILPTPFGEGVNIRILSRSFAFFNLEQLGFPKEGLNQILNLIRSPYGVILVTGPTGSGKTTTLYTALARINSLDRKILTIEDPIEYQLKGVTQMQVAPKVGFSFANALRSMLRHDPDIMMVGEIRDLETAEITIRTALTGHLVFSTLHTNDAAGAVTRLMDMGIEPYLVTSSVIGIIAQRLVRLICKECREKFLPEGEVLREIGVAPQEAKGIIFYKGRGCEACRHTGYRGRTGIYEILPFDNQIQELILSRVPATTIKQKAQNNGMKTLRQDGWDKIRRGLTTVEEVLRVTQEDEFLQESKT